MSLLVSRLFRQAKKGELKDFNLNLLSKDVRKFVKNINKDPKINLRVVEMPQLLLKKGILGYVAFNTHFKGFFPKLAKMQSVTIIIFLRTEDTNKECLHTFWHEAGHALFRTNINEDMKKKVYKEIKPVLKDPKSKLVYKQILKQYWSWQIAEETTCIIFAKQILEKGPKLLTEKDLIQSVPNLINITNILLKRLLLLLNDKKSL